MKNTNVETVPASSPKWTLNMTDWKKVGKGFLIALAGMILTLLADMIPGLDFGQYTLIVAPILMALINAALKWYQGQPRE